MKKLVPTLGAAPTLAAAQAHAEPSVADSNGDGSISPDELAAVLDEGVTGE